MEEINYNVHPPHLYPPYKSTILRSPTKPLMPVKELLKDLTMPAFGESLIGKFDNDLTKNARVNGEVVFKGRSLVIILHNTQVNRAERSVFIAFVSKFKV